MPRVKLDKYKNIAWNLFLLTIGALIFSFGVKCIAAQHEFVAGGVFGTAMLLSYLDDRLSIGVLYAVLNIPLLVLGLFYLSRRFMLYTMYSIVVASIASQVYTYTLVINDPTLAALATGIVCGAGGGFALRSMGSDGGVTILGIILYNKHNTSVGTINFAYNAILFALALPVIAIDNVLYSMIITYLTSTLMNYSMSMFDQRKLVFVISEKHKDIADTIMKHLGRGCTLMHGQGAFTMQDREVLMTVVHNFQLRRVEEIILTVDPQAFVIIENTLRVLGKGFSQRKIY